MGGKVRSRLWLLVLVAGCGGKEAGDSRDGVHPGEPAVRSRRVAADSTASEIAFLQYMIEHEWTIGSLLRHADGRALTSSGKAAVDHARKHWFENEGDLVAARRVYGGGRGMPAPPPAEPGDDLERFHGPAYEAALLGKLAGHYREELAAIDTVLPRLAEPVRALAQRIRAQRLQDIRELTPRAAE